MLRTLAAASLLLAMIACGRPEDPLATSVVDSELGTALRRDADDVRANGGLDAARTHADCGSPGNRCAPGYRCEKTAPGTYACKAERHCGAGLADCDGSPRNGCETDLTTSVNNCGACGTACTVQNGTPTCGSGTCQVAACNPGYALYGGACIPTVVDCTVDNGTGTQTWSGSSYGACVASACVAGYAVSNAACIPAVVTCSIDNGTGTQTWSGSSYGACTATSCNTGFVLSSNACLPETRNCAVANGSGTETWNPATGAYGACTASDCDAGYSLSQGTCVLTIRSCTVDNGTGTQTWNAAAGAYGACSVTSCNEAYVLSNGACIPAVTNCSVPNGAGTQTWNGTAYGNCTATSCDANYSLNTGACVANVISCTVDHGTGTQTWNGTAYGACVVATCDAGYMVAGGACVPSGTGTVMTTSGAVVPVTYVACGNGTAENCSLTVAESSCTATGKKLVSHASDGTAAVVSLGATMSCHYSISYFTNTDPLAAGQCLVGVSNARWGQCCGVNLWHGNVVSIPTVLGQQFGYVDSSDSGYVGSLRNQSGVLMSCQLTTTPAKPKAGCSTYYVACQ